MLNYQRVHSMEQHGVHQRPNLHFEPTECQMVVGSYYKLAIITGKFKLTH